MKKIILTIVLSAIYGMASAQETPTLTIDPVDITPGGKASFNLIVNVGNLDVTGFQFEKLTLPEGFALTGESAWNPNWDATPNFDVNQVGDKWICSVYSKQDVSIPKGDFVLGAIEIEAPEDIVDDVLYATIPENDFRFVIGNYTVEGTVSITINVRDYITLDENSMIAPELSDPCKVKVIRTITANQWSTICLPFDIEDVEDVFGEGVQLATLKSCTFEEESNIVKSIKIEFEEVDMLEANKPYIIKVKDNITEFTIDEAEIDPSQVRTRVGTTGKRATFWGTYASTVVPEKNVFINNDKFWYSTGKTSIKGYRCYFNFDKILPDYATSRISLFIEGEKTEIQIPELMTNDGEYYNLNGLRVETPSKGIYIKDGKKVVVK